MVKLASARECRLYGPRLRRHRAEYMNAGLYLFATVVLLTGFMAQFSRNPSSGLVLLLISLALLAAVNLHDLLAHLAAIDFRFSLLEFDTQLALVEFAVPLVQAVGSLLSIAAIFIVFLEEERGHGYKLQFHVLNLLVAGPMLWLIGSIHNSCQIYERSDGHVQILQQSVLIPYLLGSMLFVVGAVINHHHRRLSGHHPHGLHLLSDTWVWLGISGSTLLIIGGLNNVVKVFKMQQTGSLRLEKLRGGAQERLIQEREGQIPLIIDDDDSLRRRKMQPQEPVFPVAVSTPYKDVLVAGRSR